MCGKLKILIMGLPGSGKTTFALSLLDKLREHNISSAWYNGDYVRELYDDWDFSLDGRLRQAERMSEMADLCKEFGMVAVCDFVCPIEYLREVFNSDITVWLDTLEKSRFEDTNKLFETPSEYDYRITDYNQEYDVIKDIICILTQ